MGKRLFQEVYVSQSRTEELGLPGLVIVSEADDRDTVDFTYHAVHKSYFDKDKMKCPFCGGTNTAETKIRPRKFKDILTSGEKKGKVIDLVFHQRFFRCDDCKGKIFREDIDFAEEGCRYTNRLSDLLAEGTLTRTYERVCKEYGVPASKASVGVIMRRRLRMKREQMPPLKTPDSLIIFVAYYFSSAYPIVLGLYGKDMRLIDVLSGSDETAYGVFFQELEKDAVKWVYIDPDEQLHMAVAAAFPDAEIMLSEECVQRYARDAFKEIIRKDGSRCSIPHRYHTLTIAESYLSDYEHKRVNSGLRKRNRLRASYNAYQDLLVRMDKKWDVDAIRRWIDGLQEYLDEERDAGERLEKLSEFDLLRDVIDIYEPQIQTYLNMKRKPPVAMASAVVAVMDALDGMPYCIYDVLHARMLLNVEHDKRIVGGKTYRIGVPVDRLTKKMNEISSQIKKKKEEEEYGYEPED
ncbi:MAG: transposase [Lacrimispora saccharolytica]